MKFEWEKIEEVTFRAKVFGGWLVKNEYVLSMTFVPDPNHWWSIEKECDHDFKPFQLLSNPPLKVCQKCNLVFPL